MSKHVMAASVAFESAARDFGNRLKTELKDDSGESHLLAVLGVAGVVATALFAFRTQIGGLFTTFSTEIGNASN